MLAYGIYRLYVQGPVEITAAAAPTLHPLTALLVLRAFSSGCTALTGIEAISNGVPAFRPPESKNAGRTLAVMAVLMGMLFLGSIGYARPAVIAAPQETILSALARSLLGTSPAYFLIQIATLLILTVAANTSFADFPRVVAILANDGFLPRQFAHVGDRLVFANGILLLAVATGGLIIAFEGDTHALVPLFAVGAFLAFLSQSGMVIHWSGEGAGSSSWWQTAPARWLPAPPCWWSVLANSSRGVDYHPGHSAAGVPLPQRAPALQPGGAAAFAARPAPLAAPAPAGARGGACLGYPPRYDRCHALRRGDRQRHHCGVR
jgi:hypothetical protein